MEIDDREQARAEASRGRMIGSEADAIAALSPLPNDDIKFVNRIVSKTYQEWIFVTFNHVSHFL